MALIKCPRCGITFSDKAAACPKCGTRLNGVAEYAPAKNAKREIVVSLVTAMAFIMVFIDFFLSTVCHFFLGKGHFYIHRILFFYILPWLVLLLFFIIVFSSRPKYKVVLVCGTVGVIGKLIIGIIGNMMGTAILHVAVSSIFSVILAASFFQIGMQIKKIGLAILSLVASASFFILSLLTLLFLVWQRPVPEAIIYIDHILSLLKLISIALLALDFAIAFSSSTSEKIFGEDDDKKVRLNN